ncbi:MAG TPA: hypothetical protein PLX06_14035 [Fimbriimonadaceae bacterium]|nr:hypothetical protein [Fimbriimonadaceae bacterium]
MIGAAIVSLVSIGISCSDPAVGVPPADWKLSPFYKKHVDLDGLPIVSSDKVPDAALVEAWKIGREMLKNLPEARKAMIGLKVRIAIMSKDEQTLDIPEHSDLQKAFPETDWNKRARGLGATRQRPAISAGEENLLQYREDRYRGESIFIHEFAHAIFDMGIAEVDKEARRKLRETFENAKAKGRWEKTYAMTNPSEYWAEGVQSYFDCNRTADPPNGVHNHVGNRDQLKSYDPELYDLIELYFKTGWRWTRQTSKLEEKIQH